MSFSNSAVYFPLLYVPCVGGFVTSRLLHLNAAQTLHLTRLFNGAACVFLAALAIALAGRAAPFLAAVLSLPMT